MDPCAHEAGAARSSGQAFLLEEDPLVGNIGASRPKGGRSSGRLLAVAAVGVLMVSAVALSHMSGGGGGGAAVGTDADSLVLLEAVGSAGLEKVISPVTAIRQSHKRSVLKVKGALAGGTCNITEGEACPLAQMSKGKLTGVFPGGRTHCLAEGGPPYLFQVLPGDSDKLVLYFSGGGACWDSRTASLGLCSRAVGFEGKADSPELAGIFDHTRKANPWRDYTAVIIGYCTGDAHVGTQTQNWTIGPSNGEVGGDVVYQRGYTNARAAIDWAKANFPSVASLVVTGSSAGSLGTQIWAQTLLKEFEYKEAAVVADSYAAIFPAGTQGPMMREFGLCDTGLLHRDLVGLCHTGGLDAQEIFEHTMRQYPEVTFASIDSKTDFVQMAFYQIVYLSKVWRKSFGSTTMPRLIFPETFSQHMGVVYRRYNMNPNWVSYFVNGDQHMYLNNDVMYQTTPTGNLKTGLAGKLGLEALGETGYQISGGDEPPLAQWLAGVPVKSGGELKSACAGLEPAMAAPQAALVELNFLGTVVAAQEAMALLMVQTLKGTVNAALAPQIWTTASKLGWNYCDLATTLKTFRRRP